MQCRELTRNGAGAAARSTTKSDTKPV